MAVVIWETFPSINFEIQFQFHVSHKSWGGILIHPNRSCTKSVIMKFLLNVRKGYPRGRCQWSQERFVLSGQLPKVSGIQVARMPPVLTWTQMPFVLVWLDLLFHYSWVCGYIVNNAGNFKHVSTSISYL